MPDKVSEITLIIVASSVIILLLAGMIIFSLFTNQKRKFRHRQQMEEQQKTFDQEILRTQLEIQTQTFETISRELHDNVSNTLSVALLNLNLIDNGHDKESTRRLEESKSLLLEAKNAVKDFSWYISPENINGIGLLTSLKKLAERFAELKLFKINCSTTGHEFPIESSRQIIIYRIVQESLSNIVKHAGANLVDIVISFNDAMLSIEIKDDGCGFDKEKLASDAGNTHRAGIRNMIARAKMIQAELSIDSRPGKGTTTLFNYQGLPLKQEYRIL